MKRIIQIILFACIFITIAITTMNCRSSAPDLGITNGKLLPCPGSPNCVNSQMSEEKHRIDALPDRWDELKSILENTASVTIIESGDTYIRAEYKIPVFQFIDDVEFLRDAAAGKIEVRSSSRVGKSDLGVNRRRIEKLRKQLGSS